MSNPYQNALDSQSACNPLGLTKSFAADLQTLRDTEHLDTDKVARHPVTVLYLTQLVHLCQGAMIADSDCRPGTTYGEAHRACETMAKQWEQNRVGTPTEGPINIAQVAHGGLNATNIASILLIDDAHHQTIQAAARHLVAQGKGHFRYMTHYGDSTTAWRDPHCVFTGGIHNIRPDDMTVVAKAKPEGLSLVKEVKDVPSQT